MITLLVIFTAVGAIAALALVVMGRRRNPTRATLGPGGYQEVDIVVNGRYRPDNITVQKGTPVRLHFNRLEDDACSERVIISGVGVYRRLAAFQKTTVEFTPRCAGTFMFTCHMGMYRGTLTVTEPRVSPPPSDALRPPEKRHRLR